MKLQRTIVVGGIICAGAFIAALRASSEARAQEARISVATYTAAQATAGKTAYVRSCAGCHGQELTGGEFASALKGASYNQSWGGKTADTLFTYLSTKMPPANPGQLGAETYVQIIAYMLQGNGTRPSPTVALPSDLNALGKLVLPRSTMLRAAPMMPLSPLAPPMADMTPPNPLDKITPVTDALLDNPPPGEWLTWRRTYDDHGFSPLTQIDKKNVGDLRVSWAWSLPNGQDETTPLEHDGVLFVDSFGDRVQALNAVTGDLLWQYSRQLPSDARASVKRNMAIYHDRLLVPTSDDHLVALDVKTGTVVWDQELADYKKGWQTTGGPLVAKGKVMQGIAGQAPGGCVIVAVDFETGKEAWRFHTIAQPGEFGGNTWNDLPVEKRSGSSVWTAGSYDPQLNLAYFGTGQTYDTGPLLHSINKPGITNDSLYTDSTLAFNPDTGKLVWYFQHVRNDQWDLDWAFEQQLINLPVNGANQKLVVTSGKMGIYEAMDAATGKYVFSKDLGIQNVISSIDPVTGEKTINPEVVVAEPGKPHTICPHPGGGRSWIAGSYNAETKIVFVPMVETCMDLIPAAPGERGNLTSGVELVHTPSTGWRRQTWPPRSLQSGDELPLRDCPATCATNHGSPRDSRWLSRFRRFSWIAFSKRMMIQPVKNFGRCD